MAIQGTIKNKIDLQDFVLWLSEQRNHDFFATNNCLQCPIAEFVKSKENLCYISVEPDKIEIQTENDCFIMETVDWQREFINTVDRKFAKGIEAYQAYNVASEILQKENERLTT